MAKVPMDPNASPDLLEKPRAAAVRKLNLVPVLIVAGLGVIVIAVLVYSVQSRGASSAQPKATPESGVSAQKEAEEIVTQQTLGVIEARTPKDQPAAPPKGATDPDGDVAMGDAPPPPNPPSDVEIERWQRYVNLLWERHARLLKAAEAPTRVDFEKGAGASGSPSAVDPAAAWPRQPAAAPGGMGTSANPDPNQQTHKKAFFDPTRETGALSQRRRPPASPYEIKTGTVIPAVMISGIHSDLPGVLMAQVSQHVWDTATGGHLLIPQGTRLYGTYDSEVAYGQQRVLVVWTRLIFPDASTLELEGMPGADPAGFGGFKDRVDRHLLRLFGSAVLLSAIGAGFQMSQPDSHTEHPTPQQEAAAQLAQELAQVGREQMGREMDVQPTLVIRPGYRFNVMVTKDMTLTPYGFGGRREANR